MTSVTVKRLYRHISQSVCPWKQKFSSADTLQQLVPREELAGTDSKTLARDLLAMTPDVFSRAFKGSPIKRAKLRGVKRNAAVVLGNVGSAEDVAVLTRALDDPEPLVREHVASALGRLVTPD